MTNILPTPDISEVKKVGKEIGRQGIGNYLKNLFLTPQFLVSIFLLSIYFLVNQIQLNKIENNLEAKLDQKIEQKLTVVFDSSQLGFQKKDILEGPEKNSGSTLGLDDIKGEFNPENWVLDYASEDGSYHCPARRGFPYWSLWTKQKIALNFKSFSIKFKFKPENKTQTLLVSLGEYKEKDNPEKASPEIYWRLNFFDGDDITIRLYDSKGRIVAEDRLEKKPDFNSTITLLINHRIPNPNDNKISLSLELSYNPAESNSKTVHFISKKDFSVEVPSVDLESEKKQIGIGVLGGNCFRIISTGIVN